MTNELCFMVLDIYKFIASRLCEIKDRVVVSQVFNGRISRMVILPNFVCPSKLILGAMKWTGLKLMKHRCIPDIFRGIRRYAISLHDYRLDFGKLCGELSTGIP